MCFILLPPFFFLASSPYFSRPPTFSTRFQKIMQIYPVPIAGTSIYECFSDHHTYLSLPLTYSIYQLNRSDPSANSSAVNQQQATITPNLQFLLSEKERGSSLHSHVFAI